MVVHTAPDGPGLLAAVLNRAAPLEVVSPDEGMLIRNGYVYVAPTDYHLTIGGGRVVLTREQPAADTKRLRTRHAHG